MTEELTKDRVYMPCSGITATLRRLRLRKLSMGIYVGAQAIVQF